jgi:predicted permease
MGLRYTLRSLRNSPGFSVTVILTLALGIGANTAIFSAVEGLLLRPLPYPDATRLMFVTEFWPHEPIVPGPPSPDFENWRSQTKLVEDVEAYGGGAALNLTGEGEPEHTQSTMITAGLLQMMGAHFAAGRNFTSQEDVMNGPPAAILGYDLWQRRFAGSRNVVGRPITLSGKAYTVAGVLDADFQFPDNNFKSDLLVPMALPPHPNWKEEANFRFLRVVARVKRGVTTDALRTELAGILQQNAHEEPVQFVTMRKDMQVRVMTLRERLTGDIRPMVLMLQAAVGMVLLIGCLNVANLQISRSIARHREIAVRAALGAGRARVAVQLLLESLTLSLAGAGVGLVLGYVGLHYLRAFLPSSLHLAGTIHMNLLVLVFTLAMAVATCIPTGLGPALNSSQVSPTAALGAGLRITGGQSRLRSALVVAEVAIAIIVLAACGLLIRSFVTMASLDAGFDPKGVLTAHITLAGQKYAKQAQQTAFFSELLDRAQQIPGVERAALGSGLPLIGTRAAAGVSFKGRTDPPLGGRPTIQVTGVSSAYFETLKIPLLKGRVFTDQDREAAPLVVVINQAFADQFYRGEDPIGQHLEFGSREGIWREVVGVVKNVRQQGLDALESPKVFSPYRQFQEPEMLLTLRANVPPAGLTSSLAQVVHAVDPDQPIFDVLTMEQRIGEALSTRRANMILMAVLATLALTLAALGIFAVIAYFVGRRTREIGIRMALGAHRADILKMVLRHGLTMTGIGIALGLAGALAATRALKALLFSTSPTDPLTFALITLFFAAVAAAACLLPARRAALIEPASAIRDE